MLCPQCKSRNPIGNRFCRECGAKLEAAAGSLAAEESARIEAERTHERVAVLLADAFAHAERGKPDEALPLAEEAAALLPTSTSAHALRATLYERTDQNEKAVAAMERVVALNPDSLADQEKLEQLRRGVHVLPVRERGDGRFAREKRPLPGWVPLAAAAGAVAVVLGIGLVALNNATQATAPPRPVAATSPAAPSGSYYAPSQAPGAVPPPTSAPAVGRADPFAPTRESAAAPTPPARPSASSPLPPLPPPTSGSTAGTPPPKRFTPSATPPRSAPGNRALPPLTVEPPRQAESFGAGARIAVRPPTAPQTPPAAPPSGGGDGSYIRIQVGPPARAGSSPPPAPTAPPVAGDPMLRAQTFQASGRYAEAIAAYRQALGGISGVTAADAHQGIALSQQRLGNIDAARSEYRQAIALYEAAAAAGRAVGAARRGAESCRAALEVLGNG